ncbi:MAG: hypothetical protein IJ089_04515 [Clostridia bacterium]|nr:hypothetical protein [Clostridia bacterium]
MSKAIENTEVMENEAPVPQEELLMNEDELLTALTDKEQHRDNIETIEVKFGRTIFQFRIRPLSEREWDKAREKNTKYAKNRRLGGMRLPEKTDTVGYHTMLIYMATLEEDRAKLWDNKRLWAAVNAVTGTDMVDKLIPYAGKKQAIVDRIERLSGFDDESEEDESDTVKN